MLKTKMAFGCVIAATSLALAGESTRVALVGGDLSATGGEIALIAEQELQDRGISYDVLTSLDLTRVNRLKQYDVLVYAGAEALPMTASRPLQNYLRSGRDLVALGAPPFTDQYWPLDDEFLSQQELEKVLRSRGADQVIFDFQRPADRRGWGMHETNHADSRSGIDFLSEGRARFLRIQIKNFTGWDTFAREVETLGTVSDPVLRIQMRGAPQTDRVLVELVERDGSRWMTAPRIQAGWSSVLLWPEEFECWHDGGPIDRGGDGDRVQLSQVKTVRIGLATSHVTLKERDHWIDIQKMEVVRNPAATEATGEMAPMDGLFPYYKYFPVREPVRFQESPNQNVVHDLGEITVTGEVASVHPRPMGAGYLKGRPYRFVPLIDTYNRDGRRSGYLAWMMINEGRRNGDYPIYMFLRGGIPSQPFAGSSWAVFSTSNPEDYRQPALRKAFGQVVQRMLRGTYLMEGGSEHFVYMDSPEEIRLGAHTRVSLHEENPAALGLRWTVEREETGEMIFRHGQSMFRQGSRIPETDGGLIDHIQPFRIDEGLAEGTYRVTTELLDEGRVIDRISHEFNVWNPKPLEDRNYVTYQDGNFMLDGEPWFGFGINYMPSSGIALENAIDYEFFVNQTAYDPAIIDEDLEMLQSIGFNLISTFFYYRDVDTRNIMDLILRAEKYGMKVNLGLRPQADPMQFNISEVEEMITRYRFAENDTIMAYDLAWEKNWGEWDYSYGTFTGRKGYDELWKLWIRDQYGSIKAAEDEWGVDVPRKEGGLVTGPSDEQLDNDGSWRNMVAAYRSFVDWYTGIRMMKAADAVRDLAPHQMVSFRMHNTGDPTQAPSFFPFDMKAMAPFLDIMEPEAYGRIGDWERVKPGLFTGAYSRMVAPDKPLFWSEFGHHVWTGSNFDMDEARLQFQDDYYRDFLTMCRMSHVNAVACWWNAAGYRINENSDFGVFNPDKSDRPVTPVLREFAGIMKNAQPVPQPDVYLEFDRDRSSRGINDEYTRLAEEYWRLTDEGKFVGLKTPGHGTTTADVPLDAVGDGSCVRAAPAKYINGLFRRVQIRQGSEPWRMVQSGDTVPVTPGIPVEVKALLTNTDYAEWLAARSHSSGYVVLTGQSGGETVFRTDLQQDTPYMADGAFDPAVLTDGVTEKTIFHLRPNVSGRSEFNFGFGEGFYLKLDPR